MTWRRGDERKHTMLPGINLPIGFNSLHPILPPSRLLPLLPILLIKHRHNNHLRPIALCNLIRQNPIIFYWCSALVIISSRRRRRPADPAKEQDEGEEGSAGDEDDSEARIAVEEGADTESEGTGGGGPGGRGGEGRGSGGFAGREREVHFVVMVLCSFSSLLQSCFLSDLLFLCGTRVPLRSCPLSSRPSSSMCVAGSRYLGYYLSQMN